MRDIPVEVIRSDRKTVSMELRPGGQAILRVPRFMSRRAVEHFLDEHWDWLEKRRTELKNRAAQHPPAAPLTQQELAELARRAREVIPQRAAYYAELLGVDYVRITIRTQHTRWGSCSARGNLNFNCLLMLAPPAVLDSVVVHELCHRLEMNHSPRFYAHVLRVFPEYPDCRRWLKENGGNLLARIAQP